MTIEQYKEALKRALTRKELDDIRRNACLEDNSLLILPTSEFSAKPKSLYERICRLMHKREFELGLLDAESYIKTDDDGNYVDKKRLAQLKQEFYASMREIFAS